MTSQTILGTRIDCLTTDTVMDNITQAISQKTPITLATLNPEILVYAYHHPNYQSILNQSDINLADGVGVVAAAQFQTLPDKTLINWLKILIGIITRQTQKKSPLTQISGDQLTKELLETANQNQLSIYFLGASPQTQQKLQTRIADTYPKIKAFHNAGPDNIQHVSEQLKHKLVETINQSQADILLVAYGAPKQETWLYQHRSKLTPTIRIGVGGTFDDLAGITTPTPPLIRRFGLRWLWRLVTQPRRWHRIYTATFRFSQLVLRQT